MRVLARWSPPFPYTTLFRSSGKGLPASLLMSNVQATLRALAGRVATLTELAARTNELLYATSPSNKFVTAILLMIDQIGKHTSELQSQFHLVCRLLLEKKKH